MINFSSITYKNFRAVGNHPITIKLDAADTTLITGKNGVGKSTLMAAIYYALFGEDFVLTMAGIINSINLKQLEVALDFEIGNTKYRVVRGIKPKIFKIYKDDFEKAINEESTSRDYQKVLETQILKMDKRAFKQVISVGGRHYVPFMKLKAAERRDFIEDLLDIRIFSTMSEILKQKVKTLKEEIRVIDEDLKTIKEKVSLQKAFVEKLKTEKNLSIDKIESGILKLEEDSVENNEALQPLLKELSKSEADMLQYKGLDGEMTSMLRDMERLREKKRAHISKVKFYEETTTCPTCTQDIAQSHRDIIVHENGVAIDETSLIIIDTQHSHEKLLSKLEERIALSKRISTLTADIQTYHNKIFANDSVIKRARSQIDEMKTDNSSISSEENKLKEFAKRYIELDKQKKILMENQLYNEFTQKVLADDGIKTKIIKQYIPMINKYVNYYLGKLDFFCSYHLDENFNETVKSRHRDSFVYSNFSDGQQTRIDLALMLSWRDVAKSRNAVNTNLCIFDEADASMDAEGSALFVEAIKTLEKTNVIIISHKGDYLSDKVDRVIEFEIEDNFTVLKQ